MMTNNLKVPVKVLFFAKARELSGRKESELEIECSLTYECLLDTLVKEFSLELVENHLILAVNQEYKSAGHNIVLKAGDEIAVIPPLSGARRQALQNSIDPLVSGEV
uniref:Molybdopterin synthase sulfur carrier subunit n=1 Tax=Timema genevievae TaxID=629358 RepID=A0A7R9KB00_TIMGE|nr:unnamed protein product [Timema genevievae]